jgi:hypothetical protein
MSPVETIIRFWPVTFAVEVVVAAAGEAVLIAEPPSIPWKLDVPTYRLLSFKR